jgi:iron complex outermembrane receptor protein
MGTNRTLTLIDGRRRVSGSARTSAVDLNMYPANMIERIEVITGGAAAIYGADAVTGAVNVITKRDIEGIHISGTSGISQRGDARTSSLSLSTGAKLFEGRGSIALGATYVNSEGLRTNDRHYTRTRLLYHTNPANKTLADGIPDKMIHYDFGEFYYQYYPTFVQNNVNYGYTNGIVRPLFIANPTNAKGEFYGGGGEFRSDIRPLTDGDQLRSPLEQFAGLVRFDYDVTDSIRFNARAEYGHTVYEGTKTYYREDSRASWLGGAGSAWAYLDNPYLPKPVRQFMTDNKLTRLRIDRAYKEFGLLRDVHERDTFTVASELSGDLTGQLTWNVFGQYGRSVDNVSNPNTLRASR